MDFEHLEELAKKYMRDRKSHREREIGAIYFHGLRVSKSALRLRALVTEDANWDERLRCAGLFHDVGKGIGRHAHTGALLTRDLLEAELKPEDLNAVCALIAAHQDRRPDTDAHTLWEKILQDADLLDHYGSQGLWMSCTYYAYDGQQAMGELPPFYEGEWQDQTRRHRKLLNFDVSRAIFDEKCEFELSVARRMKREDAGEYICPPEGVRR